MDKPVLSGCVGGAATDLIQEWGTQPHRRAVLFDFNGTLSDDEPILFAIYREMFAAHLGWKLSERHYISRMVGKSDREILQLLIDEKPAGGGRMESLLEERHRRYVDRVRDHSPVHEATIAMVDRLHEQGVRLGIVTGAERADVEIVLSGTGLGPRIELVVAAGDAVRGKPDPQGFLIAADSLGIEPEHVLVFEDSVPGIRAARGAGMRCIAVCGTHPRDVLEPLAHAVVECLCSDLFDPGPR